MFGKTSARDIEDGSLILGRGTVGLGRRGAEAADTVGRRLELAAALSNMESRFPVPEPRKGPPPVRQFVDDARRWQKEVNTSIDRRSLILSQSKFNTTGSPSPSSSPAGLSSPRKRRHRKPGLDTSSRGGTPDVVDEDDDVSAEAARIKKRQQETLALRAAQHREAIAKAQEKRELENELAQEEAALRRLEAAQLKAERKRDEAKQREELQIQRALGREAQIAAKEEKRRDVAHERAERKAQQRRDELRMEDDRKMAALDVATRLSPLRHASRMAPVKAAAAIAKMRHTSRVTAKADTAAVRAKLADRAMVNAKDTEKNIEIIKDRHAAAVRTRMRQEDLVDDRHELVQKMKRGPVGPNAEAIALARERDDAEVRKRAAATKEHIDLQRRKQRDIARGVISIEDSKNPLLYSHMANPARYDTVEDGKFYGDLEAVDAARLRQSQSPESRSKTTMMSGAPAFESTKKQNASAARSPVGPRSNAPPVKSLLASALKHTSSSGRAAPSWARASTRSNVHFRKTSASTPTPTTTKTAATATGSTTTPNAAMRSSPIQRSTTTLSHFTTDEQNASVSSPLSLSFDDREVKTDYRGIRIPKDQALLKRKESRSPQRMRSVAGGGGGGGSPTRLGQRGDAPAVQQSHSGFAMERQTTSTIGRTPQKEKGGRSSSPRHHQNPDTSAEVDDDASAGDAASGVFLTTADPQSSSFSPTNEKRGRHISGGDGKEKASVYDSAPLSGAALFPVVENYPAYRGAVRSPFEDDDESIPGDSRRASVS